MPSSGDNCSVQDGSSDRKERSEEDHSLSVSALQEFLSVS